MLWKDTKKLGCALKLCNKLGSVSWGVPSSILTCSYDPAGKPSPSYLYYHSNLHLRTGNVAGQFDMQVTI